ncbi:MAG: hypothetical protein H7321_05280, partial [Bacteroidia bacterium]|nr:hypothetical protein [Bacteroidia bacterium]
MKKYDFKVVLIALVLLIISNSTYGQKPKMQLIAHIPPAEAKSGKTKNSVLIGGDGDEIMIGDRADNGTIITCYNTKTLKYTSKFKVDQPQIGKKDANWTKRIIKGDNILSIYGFYDKKENTNRVYGKVTNRKNKVLKKEQVLMSTESKKKKNVGQL